MAIVDRYDGFVNYLYPILTNTSRQHRILRDTMLAAMLAQYRLFHAAGKSNQASRLYEADANAAYLKELLRVMADPARKLVSRRQYEVASVHLAETGAMLGKWIGASQKRSGGG
ncbi:diversity-generating retroelement protein Avd [Thauera aromatica]|uniref:diversity-generating retroelement protein Avd n=1 Tax=Thauera aromatica TaxID=59405 RepID=UPI001FFC8089|nr:diversity-generating retroelement protein Avd [Thauera aromatica]MCK2095218.1 diversity-generating retroelement protein Avd [Thauera aromatica]